MTAGNLIPRWWARLRDSELARRTARGSFWSLVGSLAQRGASFLAWIGLARLLGERTFGELGMLTTTLNLFATLAGLGLGTTATKFVAEWRERDPARAGRVIVFCELLALIGGGLAGLLVLGAAPALAAGPLAAPQLASALRVTALLVPLGTLNGVQVSVLYGLEAFRSFAHVSLATALVAALAPVAGAWAGGLMGALLGQVAAQAIIAVVYNRAVRGQAARAGLPLRVRDSLAEAGRVWRFSLPNLLAALVVLPANWLCQSFLARRPDGYHDLAILTATGQLQLLILFLSATLGMQILPVLANLSHTDQPGRYRRALLVQFGLNAGVTMAAGAAALVAAPWLLELYGEAFLRGRAVLAVLVAAALFVSLAGVAGKAVISLGHTWIAFALNLLWAAVLLPLAMRWIAARGVLGFAQAHLAAYATLATAAGAYLVLTLRRPAPATEAA